MLKNDRIGCKFITICCMTTYKMQSFLLFCNVNLKLEAHGPVSYTHLANYAKTFAKSHNLNVMVGANAEEVGGCTSILPTSGMTPSIR